MSRPSALLPRKYIITSLICLRNEPQLIGVTCMCRRNGPSLTRTQREIDGFPGAAASGIAGSTAGAASADEIREAWEETSMRINGCLGELEVALEGLEGLE